MSFVAAQVPVTQDPADSQPSDDAIAEADAVWQSQRDAVRTQIEAAIEAARPHPLARRTLALLAEAEVDVIAEPPGYRLVERNGVARQHPEDDEPATLADLVGTLRARHPALFQPAEPDPVVADDPLPPAPAAEGAATRVWTEQSARARSLLAASGTRARALAISARTRLTRVRTHVEERFTPVPSPEGGAGSGDMAAPSAPMAPPAASLSAQADHLRGQARLAASRLRDRASSVSAAAVERGRLGWDDTRDALGAGGILRRPSTIAALVGVGLIGIVVLAAREDAPGVTEAPAPAIAETTPVTPPSAPVKPVPADADPASAGPVRGPAPARTPVPDDEPAPDDAPMPADSAPQASDITGPAEVIDTATLKIGGRTLRLFGVVWVRGGQTEELARYLGKRAVTCQPVAGSDAHLCSVDGRDLSEVVLFNGGGRASPEATPDLVAAEDRARSERLGVWAR